MRNTALFRRPLMAALLAAGTLAALVWAGLDLRFLVLPLGLSGALLVLSRLALRLHGTKMADRVIWRRQRADEAATRELRLAEVLPVAQRLLADLGWVALGLGLLSSVSEWPGVVSEHRWTPDIAYFAPYLGGFDSLAIWGIFLLTPFVVARALAEARPDIGATVDLPWTRTAAFGAVYVLLTGDGALSAAFALDGFRVLLGLGLALGFSWVALAMRRTMEFRSPGYLPRLRRALYLAEAAWIVALLGAAVALPFAIGNSLDAPYLALLLPFALILYAGVLRPAVARILGVPIGHLASLASVYVMFSGAGVLSTAFSVGVSGMFAALIVAVVISYAAMVLRNVARLEITGRYALLTPDAARTLSSLAVGAVLALVIGTGLGHLPVVSVALLDRPGTRELGESSLPFLGAFFDARYSIALLSFTMALAFLLPWALRGHTLLRYQPMLVAVSYCAVGCLAWIVASGLSAFGHGFTFGGAIAAAGMFSLGLTQLARYATASTNPALADIAGWLVASPVRGFVLGAAVAFYGLLLRPVVYEMLWFAALYEYIALLILLLTILMNVMNKLRLVAKTPEATESAWTDWSHHRHVLESKADPRSELTGALRQRFVERGDWKPLLAYLLGLLYRSEASLDAMVAVCRSLRRAAVVPSAWNILGRSGRRSKRVAAMEHSLDTVGWALASSTAPLGCVHEDDIQKAAEPFIDRGTDPEALAIALIVAHCQRGDDPEDAVDRWFSLVDAPDQVLEWLSRPWGRSSAGLSASVRRLHLVNSAIASLYGDAMPSEPGSSDSPAMGYEIGRS